MGAIRNALALAAALAMCEAAGGQVTPQQARNSGAGHPWQGRLPGVNPYSRARQTRVDIDPFVTPSVGGASLSLAFFHNSMAVASNPAMSPKWMHTYDTHVQTWNNSGSAAVVWGDHTVQLFSFNGSAWQNDDGYRDGLAWSGPNLVLTLKSRRVYTFVPTVTPGRYRLASIRDGNNNAVTLTYDTLGRLSKVTAPDATPTTSQRRLQFTYNATTGKLASVKLVAGAFSRTAKASYNLTTGRLSQFTLPNVTVGGVLTTYRVKFTTSTSENITKVTDQDGNAWSLGYTGDALAWTQRPGNTSTQRSVYSTPGPNQVRVADPLGVATTFTFDSALGRRVLTVFNSGAQVAESYADPDYAWAPSSVQRPGPETWAYDYDARGNVLGVTPPALERFDYAYDGLDRLVRAEQPLVTGDPARRRTDFEYDAAHNLRQVRRYTDSSNHLDTVYTYDARGNLTSATDALGRVTTLTRDAYGNVTLLTTPAGRQTRWTYTDTLLTHGFTRPQAVEIVGSGLGAGALLYDEWGRLVRENFPDGSGGVFVYNGRSRLVSETKGGSATQWAYALGRLVTETRGTLTAQYAYLPNSLLSSRTESGPAGARAVTYLYDTMNRLQRVAEGGQGNDYSYDAQGRLTRIDRANGADSILTYNASGLPQSLQHLDASSSPVATVQYTYFSNGQRASKTVGGVQTQYTYDMLDRLVREARAGGDVFVWAYDAAGNLTHEVRNDLPRPFNRDADGLLLSALQGPAAWVYAYDAAGRVASRNANGAWQRYAYDFRGRLLDIDTSVNGVNWSNFRAYDYDALGRRVRRDRLDAGGTVLSSRTFRYLGDRMWGNELFINNTTVAGGLTWGAGRLSDFRNHNNGVRYYPMTDADGTAVAFVNTAGQAVPYTGVFNAFGRQVVPNGAPASVVVPNANTNARGTTGLTTLIRNTGNPRTYQFQMSQAQVQATGLAPGDRITGLTWRLATSASSPWPPSPANWADYEITCAQAANSLAGMSTTFAANMTNPVLVRDGPLTIPAGAFPASPGLPAPTPNGWGFEVRFQWPYTYQGGDLVVLVTHVGSDQTALPPGLDAVANDTVNGRALYANAFQGATGDFNNTAFTIQRISSTAVDSEPERTWLSDLSVLLEESPTGLAQVGNGSQWYDAETLVAFPRGPGLTASLPHLRPALGDALSSLPHLRPGRGGSISSLPHLRPALGDAVSSRPYRRGTGDLVSSLPHLYPSLASAGGGSLSGGLAIDRQLLDASLEMAGEGGQFGPGGSGWGGTAPLPSPTGGNEVPGLDQPTAPTRPWTGGTIGSTECLDEDKDGECDDK